jgi:HPt (histidine-containing phosphotransfer) domain-containing protein
VTPDKTLDIEGVLRRLGGDRELMQEIFALFLEALPPQLERLAAAVEDADLATVVMLAHEIKGAAANIGALELQRQANLIDMSARQRFLASVREHYELLRLEQQRVCTAIKANSLS